jgi:hypothetical protein
MESRLYNTLYLKEAASILKYPLCTLFNLSLTLSTFPSEWKYANVTPVFKKDCPSNLKNYRPISLISILAKVIERLVYKHIYNYLIDNNLITSHQLVLLTGVTLAYFHSDGKVESVNDKLNSVHKGYLSIDAASLRL